MTRLRDPASVNKVVTRRPWIGRRIADRWNDNPRAWWVSTVFLGVCVIGGAWALLWPADGPLPGTPGVAEQSTPTSVAELMPAPAVLCSEQPAVDVLPELVINATYDTTWYPVGTMSAPSSPTGGPGDARRCFTRTPEGALYAVVTQLAEEATRTGMVQDAASAGVTNIRITGYQWQSFTPDKAILILQFRAAIGIETRQTAAVFNAQWANNDWVVTADDSPAAAKAAADPVRVFIPWGAT